MSDKLLTIDLMTYNYCLYIYSVFSVKKLR